MREETIEKLEGMGKAWIPGIASEEVASPFTFSMKINEKGPRGAPGASPLSITRPPIIRQADWFINHHFLTEEFINLLISGEDVSALDQ